ncbi:hypothetical protein PS1_012371 [Malus domestica]
MATTEDRLGAKPEPKEIEENFATAIACEAGKPLVIERVKVAPPNAMEMRVKTFLGTFTSSEYIGVHCGRLSKIKPLAQLDKVCILSCAIPTVSSLGTPLNVAKRKIILSCCLLASLRRPRHQPMQKLLIRLIADSTTNEHHKFKLDVGM